MRKRKKLKKLLKHIILRLIELELKIFPISLLRVLILTLHVTSRHGRCH